MVAGAFRLWWAVVMTADPQGATVIAEGDALEQNAQARAIAIAESRSGRAFYRLIHVLIRQVLFRLFRLRAHGVEHLATPGPLVLAPVHRSNLDAPLVAGLASRRTRSLGKASLFPKGPVGWINSALGGFPVNRGTADRQSMRAAEELLAAGEAMFVFPEGTRQTGPLVGEVFDGAAFLAARTGAKVVPIGIAGTEAAMPPGAKLPKRVRVAIVVGEPMVVPVSETGRLSLSARRAFTRDLRDTLQRVFDEAQAEAEQP